MHADDNIFKLALSNIPSGVIVTDTSGKIQWVNKGFTSMTGYSMEEVVGKKPGSFLQGEGSDQKTIAKMRASIAKRASFNVDILNYTKSGEELWTTVICDPLFDDAGALIGFLGIQPFTSEERKQYLQDERESVVLMKTIFEQLAFPIILANDDMDVLNVNEAAIRLLGYTRDELCTMKVSDFMVDIQPREVVALWNRFLSENEQTGKVVLQRKDESKVTVEYVAHKNIISGYHSSILVDVSEREYYEQLILSKNKQLRALNKEKVKILSIMAHDLVGPVQNLGDILTLLRTSKKDSFDFDLILQDLTKAFTNTNDFLKNMVSWANSQIHGIAIKKQKLSLNDVFESQLGRFSINMQTQKLIIRSDLNQLITVNTDIQIVNLVLRNLIANAIKHTDAGHEIVLDVEKEDKYAIVSVKDTGHGIAKADLVHVFDINFSKSNHFDVTGYGLGLNMCQQFLDKMGERIWVESELGRGTKFSFTLHFQ